MTFASTIFVILLVAIIAGVIANNMNRKQRNNNNRFHSGIMDGGYPHHIDQGHSSGGSWDGPDQGSSSDPGGHWGSYDTGDAGGGR